MNVISAQILTARLRQKAAELGFELSGACPAVTPEGIAPLARWLEAGYAGEMTYLAGRQDAYEHPHHVLSGARSLLMLGMSYLNRPVVERRPGEGRVARYAASPVDYHDLIHERLKQLRRFTLQLKPGVRTRGVVDTAPLLEREFAQLSGLGWVGKNTMLLNRQHGSWFFLAALLLDCELDYDRPTQASHCGTCTACLDACPTGAFPQPFVLDATRCISYLTIELRGSSPRELRPSIGHWLFGCDICQDVCPWNHRSEKHLVASSYPGTESHSIALHELFTLSDDQFRVRFRRTVFWRARRRGLLRNAAIVLGNQGSADAHDTLARALQDIEPLVRSAAAWALGQIATPRAVQTLRHRMETERDDDVRYEITCAIEHA